MNIMKFIRSQNHLRHSIIGLLICVTTILGFPAEVNKSSTGSSGSTYTPEFEKAVSVIKKYEGLHKNKGSLIGYGHQVLPGDKYKRGANLTEAQADELLRKDLKKLCERYRSFGKDSLILSALAYNCGIGVVAKSSVYKKLKEGNRDIKTSYLSHCRSRGKVLSQLKKRREEEFNTLFIP